MYSNTINIPDVCSPNGSNVCSNGGTCYVDDSNSIWCACPKEFDGFYCEIGKASESNTIVLSLD